MKDLNQAACLEPPKLSFEMTCGRAASSAMDLKSFGRVVILFQEAKVQLDDQVDGKLCHEVLKDLPELKEQMEKRLEPATKLREMLGWLLEKPSDEQSDGASPMTLKKLRTGEFVDEALTFRTPGGTRVLSFERQDVNQTVGQVREMVRSSSFLTDSWPVRWLRSCPAVWKR